MYHTGESSVELQVHSYTICIHMIMLTLHALLQANFIGIYY